MPCGYRGYNTDGVITQNLHRYFPPKIDLFPLPLLPGIGKLVVVSRKARMGRNPQTGEAIKIPAKRVLKFRVATDFANLYTTGIKFQGSH
ncbi:MAG: HU family DNA-binding protein [Nitrospirae bacterium]|nr:HU family DNA-binding protein [Nitrospirota bacterium]